MGTEMVAPLYPPMALATVSPNIIMADRSTSMTNYDEKAYRIAKSKNGPSLAEQKSQLARLKQDLEQFKSRQTGAAVVGSLQERIRELEASIAHADTARALDREAHRSFKDGQKEGDDDRAHADEVRLTSSRFPPRGTPGRWS